jgi:hypothetical protein
VCVSWTGLVPAFANLLSTIEEIEINFKWLFPQSHIANYQKHF